MEKLDQKGMAEPNGAHQYCVAIQH